MSTQPSKSSTLRMMIRDGELSASTARGRLERSLEFKGVVAL